jgi:uncharacterized phage protein (TIGR01671 family)
MREIRFRAWDKELKMIMEVDSLEFSKWNVICSIQGYIEKDKRCISFERNSFKNDETDRHILMQFTGLKDKNGKEIYEGDIVRFNYSDEQNGYSGSQIVKFAEFEAGFYPFCLRSRWRANIDDIEVIGNIYENPELLFNKKTQ